MLYFRLLEKVFYCPQLIAIDNKFYSVKKRIQISNLYKSDFHMHFRIKMTDESFKRFIIDYYIQISFSLLLNPNKVITVRLTCTNEVLEIELL